MRDGYVSSRREIEEEQEQQDKGEKKRRKKKKEKKRREEPDMDVDVSLRREIKEEQHSQEAHTENSKGETKRIKKKKEKQRKEEPNMDFDVSLHREFEKQQELQEDQHSQEETPHRETNKGEKTCRKKEKKRKEEPNMDVDVSLHSEIEKEQEQQEEDQHSLEENPLNKGEKKRSEKKEKKRKEEPNMDADVSLHREIEKVQEEDQHSLEENPHTENNKGEKKRSKKKKEKKRKEEGDQHSDEGNLLSENNKGEEKRSKKKKEKEEEKAETPSQKIPTQSSCADHEQRKVKKARKLLHLEKENGMGKDHAEGEDKKMAKKAKQAQDIICKSGDEEGSNCFVKENENEATKHSKKSRSSVQRDGYDPASKDDLLNNNIECSKEPLADQIEHVTNTTVAIYSSPKEIEKEKKKERKRKRVTFKDQINVADQEHVSDIPNAACENSKETVEEVWGVRFTSEEDEILKDAVWTYIKSKGWDKQEGLNKVFNSMKHKDARNCWADIKLSLPHRPRPAIRFRAHVLLEKGAHAGKWSEEEEQLLKRLQGEHGHKWKEISSLLERHRTSIKEKWRSLKRTKGKGGWTQGELQKLSDMVHRCLRAKASIPVEKKKPDRHILRDDINWQKIADTIGTHNHGSCCGKWYYNLQSSLVTDGLWANEDDLLLLQSLLESGACVEEEVEWDNLLDHRPGQVCSMRWKQMVKHLGENRTRQFLDKLDILARRYAPELLESSVNETSIEDNSIKENPLVN